MLFFSIVARLSEPLSDEEARLLKTNAAFATAKYAQRDEQSTLIFVCDAADDTLSLSAAANPDRLREQPIEEAARKFLGLLCDREARMEVSEIKGETAYENLKTADQKRLVRDYKTLAAEQGICWISRMRGREVLSPGDIDRSQLTLKAQSLAFGRALQEELARILEHPAGTDNFGHPVHYLITSNAVEQNLAAAELIAQALHTAGRVKSRRCLIDTLSTFEPIISESFGNTHGICSGGVHVIDYASEDIGATVPCAEYEDDVARVCRSVHQHRHDVLTIFCFSNKQAQVKDYLERQLPGVTFVPIMAEELSEESALAYLRELARKRGLQCEEGLTSLAREHCGQPIDQLHEQFEVWYDDHLKTKAFPQYAFMNRIPQAAEAAVSFEDNAYAQLQNMIGLKEVKRVVDQIRTSHQAQIILAKKGLSSPRPGLHMVFSGNPGTAKTSVARLLGQILKDEGVLSKGDLIEVGRADLIGKYVGWTAVKIREAFAKAAGSVLFVDEAYSLLDSRAGGFGEEAINEFVLEMERKRDDVAVIFAGYPQKMEELIESNPGLRSRFSFLLRFEDYLPEELFRILCLLAGQQGLTIHPSVKEKVLPILSEASSESDFGNGRFARNLLDQARLRLAERVVQSGGNIREEDLITLFPDDFSYQPQKPVKRCIGFGN